MNLCRNQEDNMKKNLILALGMVAGMFLSGCEMITSTSESDVTATKGSYSFGIKDSYVWKTYNMSKTRWYNDSLNIIGATVDSGTFSSLNLWTMQCVGTSSDADSQLIAYLDLSKYYATDTIKHFDSLIDSFTVTMTINNTSSRPMGVIYCSLVGPGAAWDTLYSGTHTYHFKNFAAGIESARFNYKVFFSILSFYDSTLTTGTKVSYTIDSLHLIFK